MIQNFDSYRNKDKFANLSFSKKKILALQVSQLIISQFSKNKVPLTIAGICTKLVLPVSVIQPTLDELIESKIIAEIKVEEDEEPVFQPACDTSLLTIAYVIDALENCGNNTLPDTKEFSYFSNIIEEFEASLVVSEKNKLLKEI